MNTLYQDGMIKAMKGITTLEEVFRVAKRRSRDVIAERSLEPIGGIAPKAGWLGLVTDRIRGRSWLAMPNAERHRHGIESERRLPRGGEHRDSALRRAELACLRQRSADANAAIIWSRAESHEIIP